MEKFCLKWNDYQSNIGHAFNDLREEKDFFDVTLACEDNQIEVKTPGCSIISASCLSIKNLVVLWSWRAEILTT